MRLNLSTPAGGPGRALELSASGVASSRNGSASSQTLGMVLLELMVAVAVGVLLLLVVATVFVGSAYSYSAMGNYIGMDSSSRNALDHLTREIRQAGDLVEFSPTRLKFAVLGQTNSFLIFNWDARSRLLTESKTSGSATTILLTECDQLAFSLRDGLFAPTTAIAESKGISVAWKCSRTLLGNQTTSEDMAQALIIMRNKRL
jgi:type II secretory pathway component PulJ